LIAEENKVLEENITDRKAAKWAGVLLLSAAFFLLFWGLGGRGLWGSEGRWAEITREMFLSGDFFHPTIGGKPYFDKPLLTYWLIAAFSAITGTLNEWVVRLPSAFAGVVAVWATVLLGRRLWSARVGNIAGWLLLTSYGILFWSRTAAAETENLAAITLCILWYWSRRDKLNFTAFLVFYLIAFIGSLTKGLPALVVPVLVIIPDIVRDRRWKNLFGPSHFLAFGLALVVYLSPFLYAFVDRPDGYDARGLSLVLQENFLRYFRAFDHKGPFYLYLYAVPILMLPWAPLFMASLVGLLSFWKFIDKNTRWLLTAIAIIFLFFTLSGSRREYYILPIMPLCALLMAVFLVYIPDTRMDAARRWGINVQKYACMAFVLIEIALPFVLFILKVRNHFDFFTSLSLSGIVLGGIALAAWLIVERVGFGKYLLPKEARQVGGVIAVTVVVFGGFFCWQQNIIDNFRTGRAFVERVKSQASGLPSTSIGLFLSNDAKLLFELDGNKPVQIIIESGDWELFLTNERPRILITCRKYVPLVPSEYTAFTQRTPDIAEEISPWDSASTRKNKWVAWLLDYRQIKLNTALAENEKVRDEN